MNLDDLDVEDFIRRNAVLIGLAVTPEQMPGVAANLRRIIPAAQLFLDFPIGDDVEIASVFEP